MEYAGVLVNFLSGPNCYDVSPAMLPSFSLQGFGEREATTFPIVSIRI